MLRDTFNRVHHYLRISISDKCNFRCKYCIPHGSVGFLAKKHQMTADEIFGIAEIFVQLGVKKIRLTGGEPLIRKDVGVILQRLALLPVELTLTTNAYWLDKYLSEITAAGIRSLNISLDSLSPDNFTNIVQSDGFKQVWDNILRAMGAGLHIKLNVVLMKGVNDGEIDDFVRLTETLPLEVRFIEFMPFDRNEWRKDKVIPHTTVLEALQKQYALFKLEDEENATARKFGIPNHAGTIAFITTLSDAFCATCNRIRITADGKMKNCLFGQEEYDILSAYRSGENIETLIKNALMKKHKKLGGQFTDYQKINPAQMHNRSMIQIGG